ncbi:hypothetical protein METBIDRAFT_39485 [Metschnikowia bicuspidata var. bicuspidata NRRL YB-4993]|uniref:Uncharacterized protein n=1 Tax=Metschnikowia bicuspidata var. bicuspidata NRRL YB-4993 TaxID=869754 RepID=A0A1A0HE42_9ASCO|nr:hypothetical protein METBIDRAFT_39485 [Metschnikowia bicuspidata var. bicuspidata NRRL YB-4993]OBA22255.1 hypothetical protein METBIDRAFT_39485 [Metschnikowia bicuspidata var. bicuspidata NRRL YB-4993]
MVESPLEIKNIHQARDTSAKAIQFQKDHQKDWVHGIPSTRSLITYTSLSSSERGSGNEAYLVPGLTFSDIGLTENTRHSSLDPTNDPDIQDPLDKTGGTLQSDDFESPFSGLLHVPSFSFTRPENVKPHTDVSQYIHQSHFEVGEVTYFFGGLQSDPLRALKNLGIPRSTDPSLISVHFPCDMPPYVNKEVLMSPFIVRNPCFFLFNPTRSTVHDYSKPCSDDFEPGHVCDMKGTQISDFQVFFCGGFKIDVEKVEFSKSVGRWIIEKSISTNDDAFILDVRKLSFTKISLITRLELKYSGRIGAAICSNFSTERPGHKASQFGSHPQSLTDSNYCTSGCNSTRFDSQQTASLSFPLSPFSLVSFAQPNVSHSYEEQKLDCQTSADSFSSRYSTTPQMSFDTKSFEESSHHKMSGESSFAGHTTSPVTHSDMIDDESDVLQKRDSGESSITSHKALNITDDTQLDSRHVRLDLKQEHKLPDALLSSSYRVPSMIAKSSRFFHRSLSKQSSKVNHQNVHRSSTHAKQHRIMAPLTTHDINSATKPESFKSPITAADKNDMDHIDSCRSSKHKSKHQHHMNGNGNLKGKKPARATDTLLLSDEHTDNSHKAKKDKFIIFNPEMQKNDQKPGISSICVYLFGGFFLEVKSDGRRGFTATNELLKLELILNDNQASDFHREALIDTIHPRNDTIPGPRGYFAHILTSANLSNEVCNIFGPERRTQLNYDQIDPSMPVNNSDAFSDSDGSIQTDELDLSCERDDSIHLIIHGGVDSDHQVFGDCFYFNFDKECWVSLDTYAFDYYEIPKKPFEDEDSEKLQLDAQVENPKLVEAELRCCHHKAMVYWEGDKEYVAFVGGFNNDFLRHYDRVPYESLKFDVSRLAKLLVSSVNPNLLRIPVLNLRSQVWKFKRYFYDLTELAKPGFMELLKHDCMRNSNLAINGGGILIIGKQLTICHGLVQFVPQKASDFETIQRLLENSSILMGGHFHLTFPGM